MANWTAIGACILPNAGGFIAGFIGRPSKYGKDGKKAWYDTLIRPKWTPPGWVFGPVWTTLYTSMGYASYLVWRDGGGFNGDARIPLLLYGSQLALNWAWPIIFFKNHSLKWSFMDIVALLANAVVCGVSFYNINNVAGYLYIPYISWLSLATSINYRMYMDNPQGNVSIKELNEKK